MITPESVVTFTLVPLTVEFMLRVEEQAIRDIKNNMIKIFFTIV